MQQDIDIMGQTSEQASVCSKGIDTMGQNGTKQVKLQDQKCESPESAAMWIDDIMGSNGRVGRTYFFSYSSTCSLKNVVASTSPEAFLLIRS